ncbi:hypothetical protein OHA79_21055 [Streptomyces sp. NBC_00841]|uniref:hypothetical protein n=1 Tax=unclassified Streptomyces TaxID=2593676 RepID=UPI00225C3ABA|nr:MULTISPECIES: hypothetical protein [unclassified Streptomyces]MCX4534535.1 hypothetical protein [Streptomyces sp. NBC_01669]WSA00118.1 hypothetical protein OHA79_21055 [Streptomyces sp. NBC_00841]
MAWDEWEQIKADVTNGQPVAMRLNHVPVEPGTGPSAVTGGLTSSKKAWTTAGEGVGSLRRNVSTALTELEDGQAGLDAITGCLGAAAQKDVYDSWKMYAESISERCGSLQKILEQVGRDLLTTDEAVNGEMHKLNLEYADTDAVGGQAKGR